MSGYPYDTGSSFVRHPGGYAHDAFGHFKGDDAGVRTPCFRNIPHTGIDVSPKKQGDTGAKVVSPVYGTIVETGSDPEAGLYHIIQQYGTSLFWILGHHSVFVKRSGNVERGELVARMGMSGGAKGVHLHITVATSLAAAREQIHGYVNYRNGRSVSAWAASEGLVDPWPLIEREWADEVRLREAEQERERAAAAAAEAAAKALEEALDMSKTVIIRRKSTGAMVLADFGAGAAAHIPNTAAVAGARALADEPDSIELSDASFAFALDAVANGSDPAKIAALRTSLTK